MVATNPKLTRKALVLGLHFRGFTVKQICAAFGEIKASTAYRWITWAQLNGVFARMPAPREFAIRLDHSRCESEPIQIGDATVCVECCVSGFDWRPEMQPTPPTIAKTVYDPDPEQKGLRGGK